MLMRRYQKAGKIVPSVLLLFLLLWRLDSIPSLSLWWDEGWSLLVAHNWVEVGHYGQLLNGQLQSAGLAGSWKVVAPAALGFRLFGVGGWQGRLPGVLMTLGALALLYGLAERLYNRRIAAGTLAMALLLQNHGHLNPILLGRQVLGEMPALLYLLIGYSLFWLALLYIPAQMLNVSRWYTILMVLGYTVSFWELLKHYLRGLLAASFLPGQISGDVVRVISMAKGRDHKALILYSVIVDKIALLIGVSFFSVFGLFDVSAPEAYRSLYGLTSGLAIGALSGLILLTRYGEIWLTMAQRFSWMAKFAPHLTEWGFKKIPLLSLFLPLLLAIGTQAVNLCGGYLLAYAMHITIPVLAFAAIQSVVALVQIFPISIGGIGVREGAFVSLLAWYKISPEISAAYSLIGYILSVIFLIVSWLIVEIFFLQKKNL